MERSKMKNKTKQKGYPKTNSHTSYSDSGVRRKKIEQENFSDSETDSMDDSSEPTEISSHAETHISPSGGNSDSSSGGEVDEETDSDRDTGLHFAGQDTSGESDGEGEKEDDDASKTESKAEETTLKVDDKFAKLRKEISTMSFDELQSLKEKIGLKLFNEVMYGKKTLPGQHRFKRENKNRPMEISSKKRPQKFRQVVDVKKRQIRDPRFDDLSGAYREDLFKKSYAFIEGIKTNEKEKIEKSLKKEKNEEKREKLQSLHKRMVAQEEAEKQKQKNIERQRERKRQERKLLLEGKTPYYMKKSDMKKLDLAEKYRQLKKKGKLEQYLGKKRKKNAMKEKKKLPSSQ